MNVIEATKFCPVPVHDWGTGCCRCSARRHRIPAYVFSGFRTQRTANPFLRTVWNIPRAAWQGRGAYHQRPTLQRE